MACIVELKQLHQGDRAKAAVVLKFSLCCVNKTGTGDAGGVNWNELQTTKSILMYFIE